MKLVFNPRIDSAVTAGKYEIPPQRWAVVDDSDPKVEKAMLDGRLVECDVPNYSNPRDINPEARDMVDNVTAERTSTPPPEIADPSDQPVEDTGKRKTTRGPAKKTSKE